MISVYCLCIYLSYFQKGVESLTLDQDNVSPRLELQKRDCPPGSFGRYCKKCSEGCEFNTCNSVSGECTLGCKPGYSVYSPAMCDQPCSETTYGDGCHYRCSEGCKSRLCHPATGQCVNGCAEGFYMQGGTCIEGLNECPMGCVVKRGSRTCNYTTGVCNHGCKLGWSHGPKKKCEEGYEQHGHLWLRVYHAKKVDFFDALEQCKEIDGHLALPKSKADYMIIYEAVKKFSPPAGKMVLQTPFWLGAEDLVRQDWYFWLDGTLVDSSLFAVPPGTIFLSKPCRDLRKETRFYEGAERRVYSLDHCVAMDRWLYGLSNECCAEKYPFVCQYDAK